MFNDILKVVSKRSTCPKKQVGSLLVKDGRTIAISYNGVLPGEDAINGYNKETGETSTVHAEANLISFCAKEGISTKGCTIWVSLSPCIKCAELIIQAGIEEVIYLEEYRDISSLNLLASQGIIIKIYQNGIIREL